MIVKFIVECEMKDSWVNTFCSMLNRMERDGAIGHSEKVSLYADGDGNFRPKFNIDAPYRVVKPRHKEYILDPVRVKLACTKGNLRTYVSGGLIYITDIENGETAIIGNANSTADHFIKLKDGDTNDSE